MTTLTSKGQITLPKPIRDRLGLKTGDKLDCFVEPGGNIVMKRKSARVAALVGIAHRPGRRVSIESMNRAVQEGAMARYARGTRGK